MRRDLWTIDRWYSRGRYWAEMEQHKADLSLTLTEQEQATRLGSKHLDDILSGNSAPDIAFPNELLPGLAEMDGEDYGELTWRLRRSLQKIWNREDGGDPRKIIDAIMAVERSSTRGTLVTTGLALAAGAGVWKAVDELLEGLPPRERNAVGVATVVTSSVVTSAAGPISLRIKARKVTRRLIAYRHSHVHRAG